jgi:Zn-dependent protease with chaperone function
MKRAHLLFLACLLAVPVMASRPSQDAHRSQSRPEAGLYLRLHLDGEIQFFLYAEPPLRDGARIREALRKSLACRDFGQPSIRHDREGWSLQNDCTRALVPKGLLETATLDLSPILQAVRSAGVRNFPLHISHTGAWPFRCVLPAGYEVASRTKNERAFLIPTAARPAPPVHFQFGYTFPRLARMLLPLLLLIVLAIALILIMRHSVLSKSGTWESGAAFGYRSFLKWTTVGFLLLWMVAITLLHVDRLLDFVLASRFAVSGMVPEFLLWSTAAFLPPILIEICCVMLSYPVFVEVQKAEWSRREVFQQAVWEQMCNLVPLVLFLDAVMILFLNPALAAIGFVAAYFLRNFSARRLVKVTGREPHVLSTGELRDRAFAMAKVAGVRLKQIYVIPTRKSRMANACARRGNSLVLTDQLLERLSKREVDAVLAHELAHLKRRHPGLLLLTLVVAMILAGVLTSSTEDFFSHLPPMSTFPAFVLLAVAIFYLVARRFERRADAMAVQISGDAPAMIGALVKLNRLNRVPIRWRRMQGSLLTHPSTLHRVQALARQAAIPEDRLTALINTPEEASDHYPLPPSASPDGKVFNTAYKRNLSSRLAWTLIASATLPPAAAAAVVAHSSLPVPAWAILLSGLLLSVLLALGISNMGPMWGNAALKRRVLERMKSRQRIPETLADLFFVSFSPDDSPRIYEGNYAWDVGFLHLGGDLLYYFGEETRFALRRDQIADIRLGKGPVSWWPRRSLYITWKDEESGTSGTFGLRTSDAPSIRKSSADTEKLFHRVQQWCQASSSWAAVPAGLQSIGPPSTEAVTSASPRRHGTFRSYVKGILFMTISGLLVATIFGLIETPWAWGVGYTIAVAVLISVANRIPFTRYRDRDEAKCRKG